MAALTSSVATLLDISKREDPNGKIARIVELLTQQNEVLEDMQWKEGNLPTGEKTTIRTGLPTPTWRLLNYGVQPTKSSTAQVTDNCGMLEAFSKCDVDLVKLNNNAAEYRLTEDVAHMEAMNQSLASTLFYGSTALNPERFVGLAPRYSALSTDTTKAGSNIINGSGDSDRTSIWLVGWGATTAHGIYPKGSKAGFSHEDLGEDTVLDAAGGMYRAFVTHYKWDCGLTVRDWRYVVRIANVDSAALQADASSGADIIDLMTQALEVPPSLNGAKFVFYCNRTIKSYLRRQITNKSNVQLNLENVMGKPVMSFGGFPVRRCDQITNAETAVA